MTKYLLKVGFDPQEKNDLSETPLHLAAGTYSENSLEICQILIQSGIELNARTDWGDTPAHYAALGGTMDTLKYLIELGSSVSKDNAQDCEATKLCQKLGLSKVRTHCLKITQNVAFLVNFCPPQNVAFKVLILLWHFPLIFVQLKLTCLVTLFASYRLLKT